MSDTPVDPNVIFASHLRNTMVPSIPMPDTYIQHYLDHQHDILPPPPPPGVQFVVVTQNGREECELYQSQQPVNVKRMDTRRTSNRRSAQPEHHNSNRGSHQPIHGRGGYHSRGRGQRFRRGRNNLETMATRTMMRHLDLQTKLGETTPNRGQKATNIDATLPAEEQLKDRNTRRRQDLAMEKIDKQRCDMRRKSIADARTLSITSYNTLSDAGEPEAGPSGTQHVNHPEIITVNPVELMNIAPTVNSAQVADQDMDDTYADVNLEGILIICIVMLIAHANLMLILCRFNS